LLRHQELKATVTLSLRRIKALFRLPAIIARQSGTRRCLI